MCKQNALCAVSNALRVTLIKFTTTTFRKKEDLLKRPGQTLNPQRVRLVSIQIIPNLRCHDPRKPRTGKASETEVKSAEKRKPYIIASGIRMDRGPAADA